MLHYLTIGFLDREQIAKGNAVVLQPLNQEQVLGILARYGGVLDGDVIRFPTFSARYRDGVLVCPWGWSNDSRIVDAVAGAIASACGCLVADVRNGRIIEPRQLAGQ